MVSNQWIPSFSLVVTADARLCALPLASVVETMRPLALQQLPGVPFFVRGVSSIRGETVAVVDLEMLLGAPEPAPASRLVLLRLEGHRVALAVRAVLGVHEHDPDALRSMPSLAHEAASGAVVAIGRLDGQLLLVLDAARLIPLAALEAADVPL